MLCAYVMTDVYMGVHMHTADVYVKRSLAVRETILTTASGI